MSKKYMVAVDGSDHAWKALNLACELTYAVGAELCIIHVIPYEPLPESVRRFAQVEGVAFEEESARAHAYRLMGDRITEEAAARAKKMGITTVVTKVAEGNAADQIVATVDAMDTDLLFLGSRGLGGVASLFMGSVSHKVMNASKCTCVAVK